MEWLVSWLFGGVMQAKAAGAQGCVVSPRQRPQAAPNPPRPATRPEQL